MDKQFILSEEQAVEMLEDLAESISEGNVALDGGDWKVYQPVDNDIPLRVNKSDDSLEISFKFS